jgi:hypothetical protein
MARLAADTTSNNTTAWFALAGALGGVLLSSVVAIFSAVLNHRWTRENVRQQREDELAKELREQRRQAYANYILALSRYDTQTDELMSGIRQRASEGQNGATARTAEKPSEISAIYFSLFESYAPALLLASPSVSDKIQVLSARLEAEYRRIREGIVEFRSDADQREIERIAGDLVQLMYEDIS